ncbi:MAG TPA: hypothetical protein VLB27_05765, partial [candidate division Zixibacteria bacterium]|nr:hypothetical protein [candidate division Zixibacteria bacterium]
GVDRIDFLIEFLDLVVSTMGELIGGFRHFGCLIGVRRGFRDNKLAIMSIPLYYIRRDDARAFMTAVVHSFEQPTLIAGDLDADANATMSDIKYLIDVVYNDLIPIGGFEYVDINGDCEVNVVDVVALIDYILRAGPPPGSGCAE